jgi:outer membrane lipoprotein-sorting protein
MKVKYTHKILIFLIITVLQNLVSGQGNFVPVRDIEKFKTELQKESKNTTSIVCDFVQERHLSAMTQPLVSGGDFWFKKPASVRWEYTEPFQYLIILTKKKVFVKEDNSQQEYDMQSGSVFQNLGEIMFSFILGDLDAAEKDYSIEFFENKELFFVNLIPKNPQVAAMTLIELYFDKKDYSLTKIIMHDSDKEFTSITFTNKVLNGPVSNDKFRFR